MVSSYDHSQERIAAIGLLVGLAMGAGCSYFLSDDAITKQQARTAVSSPALSPQTDGCLIRLNSAKDGAKLLKEDGKYFLVSPVPRETIDRCPGIPVENMRVGESLATITPAR